MENASKALLIAGAILIVIVLIGIGVMIINSTGSMQDQVGSTSDTMAYETFNSQFTSYEGSGRSAAQIKSLVSKVNASNAANNVTAGQDKFVAVTFTSPLTGVSSLKNTQKYTVSLTYKNGYVSDVTISQ